LPGRPGRPSHSLAASEDNNDGILVVAAPDSGPPSPLADNKQNYLPPWVDDVPDEDTGGASPFEEYKSKAINESKPVREQDSPTKSKKPPKLPPRSPSPLLARRPEKSMSSSSSPEEENRQLPSWLAAQEQEARSKSMFVDEDAGNLHQ